jgi:AcrR family transcriptional regulator
MASGEMKVDKGSPLEPAPPGARGTGRVERRRARTRQRILEVAEGLVRSRGVEAVTIDEITAAADIARRSFYHHFDSKHDLLVPVARARTRSLNRSIDCLIEHLSDPAEIVAIGLRHTLRGILDDPLCCWFILRSGLPLDRLREGIGESAARDLERGVRSGRFVIPNQAVLGDMLSGAVVGVLSAYLGGSRTEADLDDAVEGVLRLLGVPLAEAREITHRPLPPLPSEPAEGPRQSQPEPTEREET